MRKAGFLRKQAARRNPIPPIHVTSINKRISAESRSDKIGYPRDKQKKVGNALCKRFYHKPRCFAISLKRALYASNNRVSACSNALMRTISGTESDPGRA